MPRAPQRPNPHDRPVRTQPHILDCFTTSTEYRVDLPHYHAMCALDMLLARQPGDLDWNVMFTAPVRTRALALAHRIGICDDYINELITENNESNAPDPYDPT